MKIEIDYKIFLNDTPFSKDELFNELSDIIKNEKINNIPNDFIRSKKIIYINGMSISVYYRLNIEFWRLEFIVIEYFNENI